MSGEKITESKLSVYGDWLVQEANGCTCQGSDAHYGHQPGCGYEPLLKLDEIKAAFKAAGYAVVELPEPDDVGGGPQVGEFNAWWGHYPDNDPRKPQKWPNYDISAEGSRCGYGVGGQFIPSEARAFAAALLAAADAAEAVAHG